MSTRKTTMPIAIPLETMTTTDKLRAIEQIRADLVRDLDANELENILASFRRASGAWPNTQASNRKRRMADQDCSLPGALRDSR
uniref:Addiction module component n=1 Tax=Candidatus Kentrum sp. LFY TaxID=2126342 RepID=A0A450WR67_9GAMM|nr:MAG: hypothetical protein BECKLFY1418C_GA0070996_105912 [Candidatus Kentron sp. LFY]